MKEKEKLEIFEPTDVERNVEKLGFAQLIWILLVKINQAALYLRSHPNLYIDQVQQLEILLAPYLERNNFYGKAYAQLNKDYHESFERLNTQQKKSDILTQMQIKFSQDKLKLLMKLLENRGMLGDVYDETYASR